LFHGYAWARPDESDQILVQSQCCERLVSRRCVAPHRTFASIEISHYVDPYVRIVESVYLDGSTERARSTTVRRCFAKTS